MTTYLDRLLGCCRIENAKTCQFLLAVKIAECRLLTSPGLKFSRRDGHVGFVHYTNSYRLNSDCTGKLDLGTSKFFPFFFWGEKKKRENQRRIPILSHS